MAGMYKMLKFYNIRLPKEIPLVNEQWMKILNKTNTVISRELYFVF
jgi:hypothetical protein